MLLSSVQHAAKDFGPMSSALVPDVIAFRQIASEANISFYFFTWKK
jgi:hypothetical protein